MTQQIMTSEESEYYCTIRPEKAITGEVHFVVCEWQTIDSGRDSAPVCCHKVYATNEGAALRQVDTLKKYRKQYITMRDKYTCMVL